jgi:hypothetical protein
MRYTTIPVTANTINVASEAVNNVVKKHPSFTVIGGGGFGFFFDPMLNPFIFFI